MLIAVDFDATIAEHAYPDIGPAVPGAIKWCWRYIYDLNCRLILWTVRSDRTLDEAVKWCSTRGIEFYGVNSNPEQEWSTSPKAYANVYIDDAAFGCPLVLDSRKVRNMVDWSIVGPAVEKLIIEDNSKWQVKSRQSTTVVAIK